MAIAIKKITRFIIKSCIILNHPSFTRTHAGKNVALQIPVHREASVVTTPVQLLGRAGTVDALTAVSLGGVASEWLYRYLNIK